MEGINKSIYSTFKRTDGRKRERWRVEKGGDNEQEEPKRNREREEGKKKREREIKHRDMGMQEKGEGANAPARFDFAGWVRNNSANYYSALVHVDRYVAPDLYIAWL